MLKLLKSHSQLYPNLCWNRQDSWSVLCPNSLHQVNTAAAWPGELGLGFIITLGFQHPFSCFQIHTGKAFSSLKCHLPTSSCPSEISQHNFTRLHCLEQHKDACTTHANANMFNVTLVTPWTKFVPAQMEHYCTHIVVYVLLCIILTDRW